MEYKDQEKIIADIETHVDVNQLTYKNIKVWPIIRLIIWKSIFDGPPKPKQTRTKKIIFKRAVRFVKNNFILKKNRYIKADALFLVAPNERRILLNGKYYSAPSNSADDLLKEMGISSAMLDLSRKRSPIYGNTFFIDRETVDSPIREKLYELKKRYFPETLNHIVGWEKLKSHVQNNYPEHAPREAEVINFMENVLRYENIFTRILKKIQPKTAFLVCYYHPAAMGYIKACRNLGIKTTDIQHGDQYGMYRNWNNVPKEGYELLPSSFWCWGENSVKGINDWSLPAHPEHKAFLGGNPWISRFINEALIAKKNSQKINAMIALTNVAYDVTNIISAVKNSPDNINWIIRPHPAMPDEIKKFKDTENRFEIDANPLFFESLKNMDFIITPCSTVAYEALLFKTHPIITHTDGQEKFREYISKGLFSYAETGNNILEILQKDKSSFNFHEEVPYMETDMVKIKNNLLNLIKS